MKKVIWIATILSGAGLVVFGMLDEKNLAWAITFGTTFYHFAMRLIVGGILPKRSDYALQNGWFTPKAWEKSLYRALRVQRWKGRMPTYAPEEFDSSLGLEVLLRNMCHAELVHELIIVLSFVPLACIPVFGEPAVFGLTSLAAACFDALFVIMQRYNRPRVMLLLQRKQRK